MVTVTTPSGEQVTGVLDHMDDFDVSLRDSSGEYHSWKRTPRTEGGEKRSLRGSRRAS